VAPQSSSLFSENANFLPEAAKLTDDSGVQEFLDGIWTES
jgi:hypothetical protein